MPRMRGRSQLAMVALVALVALAIAALVTGWPQRTAPGLEDAAGDLEGTPTEITDPMATHAPTAPPAVPPPPRTRPDDVAAPVGQVTISDPEEDLTDSGGIPRQPPFPAADLVGVTVEGDGAALTVTFALAGPPPQRSDTLLWSLDVWVDGERAATVTVQQQGSRHVAGVLDWETLAQHSPPHPVEVDGAEVRVRVPLELLPMVAERFEWQALAQVEGGYEDRAPDEGRAAFPADG